jgi:hypothetical protein
MRWAEFYPGDGYRMAGHDGCFAESPKPDAGCEWIDLFRFTTSRATRVIPSAQYDLRPLILNFTDERGADLLHHWRPDKKFIRWKRPLQAFYPWCPITVPHLPAWDVFSFRKVSGWSYPAFRYPRREPRPPAYLRELVQPFEPTDKDIRRWRTHHWNKRKKNLPGWSRNQRKPWAEDWRTERKMRDLNARLDLYEYGTGRLTVARMTAKVNARLFPVFLEASKAKGIVVKQTFWPGGEAPRGSTETNPGDRRRRGQAARAAKAARSQNEPLYRTRGKK